MDFRRLARGVFFAMLVLALGVAVGGRIRGYSFKELVMMAQSVVAVQCERKTVEDRLAEIERSRPDLVPLAKNAGDGLSIFVFKNERRVELRAKGWDAPRVYTMTGFSGELGPKLEEGDGQIPEGGLWR